MLALYIAAGIFGGPLSPADGDMTAPKERVVVIPRVQSKVLVAIGAPLGAPRYEQAYDPSDHGEYAMYFGDRLQDGEIIADIEYIGISAAGAALGISIDVTAGHIPRITNDGGHVQYWPLVDPDEWSARAFDATGTDVVVKARIVTSGGRRWERSAIHEVRQL